MSDFLTRLIDRALERGPRLERRKPSMFEPLIAEPAVIEEQAAFVETSPPGPVSAVREEQERPLSRSPQQSAEAPQPVAAAPSIAPAPAGGQRPPVLGDPSIVAPPVTERLVDRVETRARDVETIVERTESRTVERHETIRESAIQEQTTIVERHVPGPPALQPKIRADETIAITSPASGVAVQAALPAVRRADERLSLAPPVVRSPGERSPQVVETQAPTVTVTIGRVEIRAAQPPKAPEKERAASVPQLSLDDYLKRRSGGAQ